MVSMEHGDQARRRGPRAGHLGDGLLNRKMLASRTHLHHWSVKTRRSGHTSCHIAEADVKVVSSVGVERSTIAPLQGFWSFRDVHGSDIHLLTMSRRCLARGSDPKAVSLVRNPKAARPDRWRDSARERR